MAKTKQQHEKDIIKVIRGKKIFRISHIFNHYLELGSSQFYNLELEKSENIKEALLQNREKAKEHMIHKWVSGENSTLQIAAFRLLADKEEHQLLNQQYVDHTTKGEQIRFNIGFTTEDDKS